MNETEKYLVLIARYLQGELSSAEKEHLMQWVQENEEHREVFREMESTWKVGVAEDDYEPDVEQGWSRFKNAIAEAPSKAETTAKVRKLGWPRITRWAASLLVLIAAGVWLWQSQAKDDLVAVNTASGETRTLYLPDSSRVILNENSIITYQQDFSQERKVRLSGEAFFEVLQTNGKRFTVTTEQSKVEVLGTSFNVKDDAQTAASVHVVTGLVAFTPIEEENYIYLKAGEYATLDDPAQKEPIEVQEYASNSFETWRTNELKFNSISMQKLITDLNQYFDVNITVANQDILQCRFTGNFSDPQLSEILEVLQVSMDISIERVEDQIILSGSGCN